MLICLHCAMMHSSLHILVSLSGVAHALDGSPSTLSCKSVLSDLQTQIAAGETSEVQKKNYMVHKCNAVQPIWYQPSLPSFSCKISDANAKRSCDTTKQGYNRALDNMKKEAKSEMSSAMHNLKKCEDATKAHASSSTQIATLKTQYANHRCQNQGGKKGPQIGENQIDAGGKLGPPVAVIRRRRNGSPMRRRRGSSGSSRRRRGATRSRGSTGGRRRRGASPRPRRRGASPHPSLRKEWCRSNEGKFGGYCRKDRFKSAEECYAINIPGTVAIQYRTGSCDFYRLNGAAPKDCPTGFHPGRGTTTKGYKTESTRYGGVHCKLLNR